MRTCSAIISISFIAWINYFDQLSSSFSSIYLLDFLLFSLKDKSLIFNFFRFCSKNGNNSEISKKKNKWRIEFIGISLPNYLSQSSKYCMKEWRKIKICITIITNKRNLKQIKSKFSKFKTDENQNFKIIFIPNMLFIYK